MGKKKSHDRPEIKTIIESIFNDLAINGEKTIADITKGTSYHHRTVLNYLELIEYIQAQRKLILKRTGHSYLASLEKKEN